MTTQQPLVSVIIPVYNVEQYLDECVQSVLTQTYQNVEIILVDDGSTDSSGAMCDQYAVQDARVQVIHKENGGLSSARNCGFDNATGEYVYFLDSDDYIVSSALETLLTAAIQNQADVVFFDAESFSEMSDSFQGKDNYIRKHRYESNTGIVVLEQLQNNKEYHSVVYLLFLRRDFLLQNNLHFINGIVYEDMVYTYQVFSLAKKVIQCQEKLHCRRFRADSIMTGKKSKKYFDSCCTAYNTVRQFAECEGLLDLPVTQSYLIRLAFNIFNNYEKLSGSDKKVCRADLKVAKKELKANGFYQDISLKARCYGKLWWALCKGFQKIFLKG